jgi:sugar lactone lactonase YvrE
MSRPARSCASALLVIATVLAATSGCRRNGRPTPTFIAPAPEQHRIIPRLSPQPEPATPPEPEQRRRSPEHPEGVLHFARKRMPAGESRLPMELYEIARDRVSRMRSLQKLQRRDATASGVWESLGPGNIGGRTRALLIDPADPETLYAGTASGGVWKTTNGGASWRPLADRLSNLTVNALAMDPQNPQILYAGTGEGYLIGNPGGANTSGLLQGLGIFKSADGGETWRRLDATANPNFWYVNDLAISRNDPQRIYAATETGVWLSRNGGENWTRAFNPLVNNAPIPGGCTDLAMRTDRSTDSLFAVCGAAMGQIYRNMDAAGSAPWTLVLADPLMARVSIAIAPSNQDTVYAVASQAAPGPFSWALYAVFRSTRSGDANTWEARVRNTDPLKVNRAILSSPGLAYGPSCGVGANENYASWTYHNLSIAVDPKDENRVWVGAVDAHRSDDGGANWGTAGNAWFPDTTTLAFHLHPDHHAFVFHPGYDGAANQTLFLATDGGVYRTDHARSAVGTSPIDYCNGAGIGVKWRGLNTGFAATQFYHGSVLPDGSAFLGGAQDNGTVYGPEVAGPNGWYNIGGGDGGPSAVDWSDKRTIYLQSQNRVLRKSTNGGKTSSPAVFGIADSAFFVNPLELDPSDPRRLWTSGNSLWRSDNGAAVWNQASATPSGAMVISALAVSPTDPNRVAAGRVDGVILTTTQALTAGSQTNWEQSQPRQGFVSSVTFDPVDRNVLYATYSWFGGGAKVWRSVNGGVSWTSIDGAGAGALPDLPVHALVVDPADSRRLFIGTDLGIFVTVNGGLTWEVEESGFPNVITERLLIQVENEKTRLYAFTHGRGAWRLTLAETGCVHRLAVNTLNAEPDATSGRIEVTGSCPWQAESHADWISIRAEGPEIEYRVEANPSVNPRAGTVRAGTRAFAVRQKGRADNTAPSITIGTPTGATDQASMVISGMVSDDGNLASISWASDRGGSGAVSGSATWQASVPLLAGRNTIMVTAIDQAGNAGSAQVAIDRTVNSNDTTQPSILVVEPDAGARVVSSGRIAVRGSAVDDGTVAQVVWSNDRGGSGVATGTAAWNAGFVPLQQGRNRITVTAWDSAGNSGQTTVEVIANLEQVISTIAGNGQRGEAIEAVPATQTPMQTPVNLAIDRDGSLLVADSRNNQVRRISADGLIRTVAGSGKLGLDLEEKVAREAAMNAPRGLAVDRDGGIIAVEFQSRVIRKITPDGALVHVGGTGVEGRGGDGGLATQASLLNPNMALIDGEGNLLIADTGNNRIRKIDQSGTITTFAGTGFAGRSGDGGPAAQARIPNPVGLALDPENGDLYISETNTHTIRKIDKTGAVSTVVGTGIPGFGGDGGPAVMAQLSQPFGLALHKSRLYIADQGNHRIRVVDLTTGAISTAAGSGQPGFGGDGGAPENAQLWFPTGVAVDSVGHLYVADQGNNRIRVIRPPAP